MAHPLLLPALGNAHNNFVFFSLRLSVLELGEVRNRQTDGRTDGRTGMTRTAAYYDGRTETKQTLDR